MADVPNQFKAGAKTARANIVAVEAVIESSFDPAVRDMEDGAWESTAADTWFLDLSGYKTSVGRAVGDAIADIDLVIAREPDEVLDTDPRATWTPR